jgi:DNA polymerase III subunit delta'
MAFSDIIGHGKQITILRQALSADRLHHAYLFLGPHGTGKRTIALALAQALHCNQSELDSCGKCGQCHAVCNGNHADVRLIEPLSGKKEISIQQVRDLEKELSFRSFSGKKKVAIIDPAPLMNPAAQNALLKTLEEPPPGCLLILIASNAGGVIPTIRSRAVALTFGSIPRDLLVKYFISTAGRTEDQAEVLAALSNGSLSAATMGAKQKLLEKRREWLELMACLTPGNYHAAMASAERLTRDRADTLSFLEWLEIWLRDLLVYRVDPFSEKLVNLDMRAEIERQYTDVSFDQLDCLLEKTRDAGRRVQRNLNRRMVLEDLLFGMVRDADG